MKPMNKPKIVTVTEVCNLGHKHKSTWVCWEMTIDEMKTTMVLEKYHDIKNELWSDNEDES